MKFYAGIDLHTRNSVVCVIVYPGERLRIMTISINYLLPPPEHNVPVVERAFFGQNALDFANFPEIEWSLWTERVMSRAANPSSFRGGAIMNRECLFSRSILIVAVVFFLLPLLTGCADVYVTAYYDDQTWVERDTPLMISCEGSLFGTVFETMAGTTSTGHCTLDLMELGANPLELVYMCEVTDILDGCCGQVQIFTTTPMMYTVNLGCGKYNTCGSPYY